MKKEFYFLAEDGTKLLASEGELFFNEETRFSWWWPFIIKVLVAYRLTNGEWIMEDED